MINLIQLREPVDKHGGNDEGKRSLPLGRKLARVYCLRLISKENTASILVLLSSGGPTSVVPL